MFFALRIAGSFLTACAVVAVMLLFAVQIWGGFSRELTPRQELETHPVELLVGYDSLDVAELFGEPRRELPEIAEPPPAWSPEPAIAPAGRGPTRVDEELSSRPD